MLKVNWVHQSSWWRLGLFIPSLLLACALNSRVETVGSVAHVPQLTVGAATYAQAQPDWATVERDVITELNRVRQNPASYIPILESYLNSIDAQGNIPNGCGPGCTRRARVTHEAVQEAITALQMQSGRPVGAVIEASAVAQSAKARVQELAPGVRDFNGTYGTSAYDRLARFSVAHFEFGETTTYEARTGQEVVMQLIISRVGRAHIFHPPWTHAGVGCGSHDSTLGSVCVIDYIIADITTRFRVVNAGDTTLQRLQMNGTDILGGPLAPGQAREIELGAQCRTNDEANFSLQFGGGTPATEFPVRPCGGVLTLNHDGNIDVYFPQQR